MYVLIQCTGKLSILLLYQRIFDTGNCTGWFRISLKVLIAVTFVLETVYVFLVAFQCMPVSSLWDGTMAEAKCMNVGLAFVIGGTINITGDVILMVLPIPQLRKLQVSRKKKVAIAIMFAIASL
jgi:hypothetical protein